MLAIAAGAFFFALTRDAHAQKAIDSADADASTEKKSHKENHEILHERASDKDDILEDADAIGAVRMGAGYSKIFHSPVVAMSFEDEFTIMKLGKHARFHVLFGMDGYDADFFRDAPIHRSFLDVDVGAGINFFVGKPLVSISASLGPGYTGANQGFLPDGFGFGERVQFFPFYRTLMEAIACEDGWLSSWVLSGLSVWGEARQDFFGTSAGNTFSAGVGVDLARNVLLPIVHKVLTGHCGLR